MVAPYLRIVSGSKRINFYSWRFRVNDELMPNGLIRSGPSRVSCQREKFSADLTYSLLQLESFGYGFFPIPLTP